MEKCNAMDDSSEVIVIECNEQLRESVTPEQLKALIENKNKSQNKNN